MRTGGLFTHGIDFVRTGKTGQCLSLSIRARQDLLAGRSSARKGRLVSEARHCVEPQPPLPLRRQPTPLSRMGSLAVCSALRHPVSKGWGIFVCFSPYLLEASPVYNVLRYPFVKGMGIFRDFLPYLWQTPGTFATLFPPSKVHPSPIKQTCRTPQRRFLYGTVSRVPRVQKDAGFLYRMYPQAARVQQKAPFLYRTENRPEVIEL